MDNQITLDISDINVAHVKKLRQEKPDFNISHKFSRVDENKQVTKMTLALHAVYRNDEELLDYLISENVDLNILSSYHSPLLVAVINEDLKLVKKLHRAGANVNARKGDSGFTALHIAVVNKNYGISEYLIDNGADVNLVEPYNEKLGHTPVLIAISIGSHGIASLLLRNGASPYSEIDLSQLNVSGVKKILGDMTRINVNSFFICKKSLDHPPTTLAHLAAKFKNEELLDFLIKSNADININIPYQGTVLHAAVKTGNLDGVKKLCELGANINVASLDSYSETPLIVATKGGYFEIAKYLLDNGANPNTNLTCRTPNALHIAVEKGYENIVELLLKNDADPNAKFDGKETPLMYACKTGNLDLIKMLVTYGSIYDSGAIRESLRNDNSRILDYLLALDVDAIDNCLTDKKSEEPILHYARKLLWLGGNYSFEKDVLYPTNYDTLEVILDAGVDVNSVNSENELAVERIHFRQSLLDHRYIKRHIVKLKQANIYVCQKNIEAVEKGFDDIRTECDQEIAKLKSDKIVSSNLAFFKVFHKSLHSLAIHLRHTKINDIVNKNKLFAAYPIYGGMIYYKLAKTQRRIELLKNAEEFLDYVLIYCLKLPHTFTRELYMYFTNENLQKLI